MIEIDAYKDGIRVVLTQEGHLIAYVSKALTPKSQLFSIYQKETLAILFTIKKWETNLVS